MRPCGRWPSVRNRSTEEHSMQAEPRYDVIWPLSPKRARIAARPARHARREGHRRAVEPHVRSTGGRQRRPRPALPAAARALKRRSPGSPLVEHTAFGNIHGADESTSSPACRRGSPRWASTACRRHRPLRQLHGGDDARLHRLREGWISGGGDRRIAVRDAGCPPGRALGDRGRPACHLPRAHADGQQGRVPREDRRHDRRPDRRRPDGEQPPPR